MVWPAAIETLIWSTRWRFCRPGTGDAMLSATDDGIFELSVSNAGAEIPPLALAQLFKPFVRGQAVPNQQGLGLGLYIAAEIAKTHKGTIDAQSSPEETRFTFRMPLSP